MCSWNTVLQKGSQMKKSQTLLIILLIFSMLTGCEDEAPQVNSSAESSIILPVEVQPKGVRRFGLGMSEGEAGFGAAFEVAQQVGIEQVELNLPWNLIETGEKSYTDPWNVLKDIAFYSEYDIQVLLSLAVIDTVNRTTPDYLNQLAYDDPAHITAFNQMVDWVLAEVPDSVTIAAISIGNEVDLVLTEETWPAYIRFVEATSAHLHENHPNIRVGVKVTMMNGLLENGRIQTHVQNLNQSSDVIMLNYYPLNEKFHVMSPDLVHTHLAEVTELFAGQEIWLTEVGYPSGEQYNKSSEAKQAEFFHEFFSAWDEHADQITYALVDWLHDQSPEAVKEFESYYGLSTPGFVEFLATLGVRNYDNTDKAAWRQLLAETEARNWTNP
jgi:hypothetical protein